MMIDDPDEREIGEREQSGRRAAPWLIGLATLLAIVSVLSTWVRAQALDTDTWVETTDELLQEEAIRASLSVYLVDVLYEELDVAGDIEARLPDDLAGLAPPIAGALRGPAVQLVERSIASDAFRAVWIDVNRRAHETLVAILRDETRAGTSAADGSVTLNVGELVRLVGERLGLSDDLLDRIPDDAGQITVLRSETLSDVQGAVEVLDFLSWFSFLLVVALYGFAVYGAVGRRRVVLGHVGGSLVAAGITVLLLRSIALRVGVDAVVSDPTRRPIGTLAGEVATSLIRQMAWSGIVYGVVLVGFAALLGEHRWAVTVRGWLAPVVTASVPVVASAIVGVLLVLAWWSPGRAFEGWATSLVLAALIVAAVVALRRVGAPPAGEPET